MPRQTLSGRVVVGVSEIELQPKIFIQMLGPFQVFRDGVQMMPKDFGSRKARALLQRLADSRNAVVSQELLLEALWPDLPEEKALRSFRVRISELRRLLAPERLADAPIERVGKGYMLRTGDGVVETDVDEFVSRATAALHLPATPHAIPRLQAGLQRYVGRYMEDDPYTEQWYGPRERFRTLFVTTAERLAHVYESLGQYDEGTHFLQALLSEADPDESLYRALIRLQYLDGDQTGALRTFEECRTHLQTEHDTMPSPETMRLLKKVMRHETLDSPGLPSSTPDGGKTSLRPKPDLQTVWPFLGRQGELTRLRGHVEQLQDRRGGVVWMHGPSGIGKTRLLREAIDGQAVSQGFRTVWMQGSQLNSRIPFAAIIDGLQTGMQPALTAKEIKQLMAPASSHLQQLTGWIAGASAEAKRRNQAAGETVDDLVIRQEVLALFGRLAEQKPVVFCIDDAHALDAASRALLFALARRTTEWPLLIIVASRRPPAEDELGNDVTRADAPIVTIELGPLPATALRPLSGEGITTDWTTQWLRQLHTETAGEPFLLTERLREMKRNNLIDVVDGEIVFPSGLFELITDVSRAVTPSQAGGGGRDDVHDEWHTLNDDQRALMQKASALGDSLTLERLELLSIKPPRMFHRVLEQLIRLGYLSLGGIDGAGKMKLSFTHSRLQQRTYRTLSRSERMWYHGRIFELLEADPILSSEAPVEETPSKRKQGKPAIERTRTLSAVAHHALLAERWEAAAKWSLKAAHAVKLISPGPEVVTLAKQAYEAARRSTGENQEALEHEARAILADALFHVGSHEDALPLYEKLVQAPDADLLKISRRLTRIYLHLYMFDEATAFVKGTLKRARAEEDGDMLVRATLDGAYIHYRSGDLPKALAMGHEVLDRLHARPPERAIAHHQLAASYWDLGAYGPALEHARAGLELRRERRPSEHLPSLNLLGELYQDLFCTDLAHKVHREALDLAVELGEIAYSTEVWRNIGLNYVHEGRIDEGLNTLEQAWLQVQDLNLAPYWREIHLRSLLEANILAHRPAQVRKLLTQYEEAIGPRETSFVTIFSVALSLLEGHMDKGEEALEQLIAFWDQSGRRARVAHVLLFAGQEFKLHGRHERAATYLSLATEELERICTEVPADVCDHIRASRQYIAAQQLMQVG